MSNLSLDEISQHLLSAISVNIQGFINAPLPIIIPSIGQREIFLNINYKRNSFSLKTNLIIIFHAQNITTNEKWKFIIN